jgi:hypothetical protein
MKLILSHGQLGEGSFVPLFDSDTFLAAIDRRDDDRLMYDNISKKRLQRNLFFLFRYSLFFYYKVRVKPFRKTETR